MEKQSKFMYESPMVDIVEIEVEKGFATSTGGAGEDFNPITPSWSNLKQW